MKKRLFLLLILAVQTVTGDEATEQKKKDPLRLFHEATYCVAYELGDPPQNPEVVSSDKSFESLKKARILQTRTHLNVIGLTSQTIRQKLLSKEQITELTNATFKSKVYYPAFDCYDPHHVFVFYDFFGKPHACIEVCFTCNAIKFARDLNDPTTPRKLDKSEYEPEPFGGDDYDRYEDWSPFRASGDFLAIAKICIDSGMGLGEFKTLEEFQKARQPIQK
ncbi:hypothetical protein V2O64_21990 [Verrucomicrobiaceae bacterium 227]